MTHFGNAVPLLPWPGSRPVASPIGSGFWGRVVGGALKVSALLGGVGAALTVATLLVGGRDGPSPRAAVEGAAWLDVNRPMARFDVVAADFERLPLTYRARRHAEGGGRQDVLTYGAIGGGTPFLQIALYRVGGEAAPLGHAGADIAEAVSEAGFTAALVGPSASFSTSFGPVDASEVRPTGATAAPPCLGFRGAPDGGATLRFAGVMCPPEGRAASRDTLACVIDRVDLLAAADDPQLQEVFVGAERSRKIACEPKLAAEIPQTPRGWLFPGEKPPLRGAIISAADPGGQIR